jgi:hypothetical protein
MQCTPFEKLSLSLHILHLKYVIPFKFIWEIQNRLSCVWEVVDLLLPKPKTFYPIIKLSFLSRVERMSVKVGVRVRPFNKREEGLGAKLCV